MSIYKKNVIIYCLLDVSYLVLSLHLIISYYVAEAVNWLPFIPFVIILFLGGWGLFIYRSKNPSVLPITQKQYTLTRILMFTFCATYVLFLIIFPNPQASSAYISIAFGSFLSLISISALILHIHLLRQRHS